MTRKINTYKEIVFNNNTGGTRESGFSDHAVDSNGHPTLTSAPSNSSGNHPYPPWRSNYRGDYRDLPQQPLCTRDLLCWAFQIARGMDYLADRKVCARWVMKSQNLAVVVALIASSQCWIDPFNRFFTETWPRVTFFWLTIISWK